MIPIRPFNFFSEDLRSKDENISRLRHVNVELIERLRTTQQSAENVLNVGDRRDPHWSWTPMNNSFLFSAPISVLYYRDTQINHEKRDELSDLKNYKNACISLKTVSL